MWIVKHRNIFYGISVVFVVISVAALLTWGLKVGIDFNGGSLLEIAYNESPAPTNEEVSEALTSVGIEGSSVRPTGETGYIIRTPFLSPEQFSAMNVALTSGAHTFEQKRYDSIGPTIGTELQTKSVWAVVLVLVAIALFIMLAFRHVSKPISSWKYGLVALVSLAHDVIIPVGAFSILGHFMGAEVDTLFVTAVLVVLGFSVHDTIVVFDRVRENLKRNHDTKTDEPFEETVGKSISQTMNRSINTSLTVVFVLATLLIMGPSVTHFFVTALLIGVVVGTYSSVFIASPLLVTIGKMQKPHVETKNKR